MGPTLSVVGAALELIGVVVAAVGLRRTWHEFRPDDRYLGPLVEWAGRTRRRVTAPMRRLLGRILRRPTDAVTAIAGSAFGWGVSGEGRLRVDFPTLDASLTVEEALVALDGRTRKVMSQLNDAEERIAGDLKRRREEVAGLEGRLTAEVKRLEDQDRALAIGGARLEGAGLLLIAVGVLLQGLGAITHS